VSITDGFVGRIARLRSSLPTLSDLVVGAVAGACAFLAGFAVTGLVESRHLRSPDRPVVSFFFVATDVSGEVDVGPDGPLPGLYRFVAWQFHSLHGVGFQYGGGPAPLSTPPPARPLVVLPPLALLAAGWLVARRSTDAELSGTRRGALAALGYLPLAMLTAATSTWIPPNSVKIVRRGIGGGVYPAPSIGVSTAEGALLAGVVVPVAFGALGGYLADVSVDGDWPVATAVRGGVAGAFAFLAGWILTFRRTTAPYQTEWVRFAYRTTRAGDSRTVVPDGVQPGDPVGVTWVYHRLHDATVDVRYLEPVSDGIDRLGIYETESLALLVPLLLVAVGAAMVSTTGDQRLRSAAIRGATVVVGYLPLAVLTGLLAVWAPDVSPQVAFGVSFVDAVLLTGLAYPVVFGGIGGVTAYSLDAATEFVSESVVGSRS
jgi:uncharacterized membrane protein (Fun14 family)